jgi:hypothetical protein
MFSLPAAKMTCSMIDAEGSLKLLHLTVLLNAMVLLDGSLFAAAAHFTSYPA